MNGASAALSKQSNINYTIHRIKNVMALLAEANCTQAGSAHCTSPSTSGGNERRLGKYQQESKIVSDLSPVSETISELKAMSTIKKTSLLFKIVKAKSIFSMRPDDNS